MGWWADGVLELVIAAVALGSNLGDRDAHIGFAIARLATLLDNLKTSRCYETVPVGASGPQPLFLNAAAVGETTLPAPAFLDALLGIEHERGRQRPHPNAPRTLDLDLILFGDAVIEEPRLRVPHPRFRERRFVLEPLAEVAADLRDPVTGKTAGQLLAELSAHAL